MSASHLVHADCPSCGWAALLPAPDLAALGGCRACGGPLATRPSPLPWHGRAVFAFEGKG